MLTNTLSAFWKAVEIKSLFLVQSATASSQPWDLLEPQFPHLRNDGHFCHLLPSQDCWEIQRRWYRSEHSVKGSASHPKVGKTVRIICKKKKKKGHSFKCSFVPLLHLIKSKEMSGLILRDQDYVFAQAEKCALGIHLIWFFYALGLKPYLEFSCLFILLRILMLM